MGHCKTQYLILVGGGGSSFFSDLLYLPDKTLFETIIVPLNQRAGCQLECHRPQTPSLRLPGARAQRLESSFAYPGQLYRRQNRRSRDYKLVWGCKRSDKDGVRAEFFACVTGIYRLKFGLSC